MLQEKANQDSEKSVMSNLNKVGRIAFSPISFLWRIFNTVYSLYSLGYKL